MRHGGGNLKLFFTFRNRKRGMKIVERRGGLLSAILVVIMVEVALCLGQAV